MPVLIGHASSFAILPHAGMVVKDQRVGLNPRCWLVVGVSMHAVTTRELQSFEWDKYSWVSDCAGTGKLYVGRPAFQGLGKYMGFQYTHESTCTIKENACFLAYHMRSTVNRKRREALAIMMALHPRLGQDSPLAVLGDALSVVGRFF